MDELTLPIPELVDVIPAEQADALIHAARRELAQLNDRLQAALVAADAAERRSRSVGADSTLLGRAAEQVQLFIEEHRSATDAELKVLLDAASDQARARVEGARADADRMTADARRLRDGALRSPLDDGDGLRPPATDGVAAPSFLEAGVIDLDEAGPAHEPPGPAHEPPGPPEPLWLPEAPAAAAAADPDTPVADGSVDRWWHGADTVEGNGDSPRAHVSTDAPAAELPTAAVPVVAPDPTPARLRLGSVPAFALLQVAALLVVLVVLLAFVG